MKGEWIIVHPTDSFSMLPIYECSVCKNSYNGYYPDSVCVHCGSKNKVNTKKYISKPIFGSDAKSSTNHTSVSTNEYDRNFKINLNK